MGLAWVPEETEGRYERGWGKGVGIINFVRVFMGGEMGDEGP